MSAMRPAERDQNGQELWAPVLAHAGMGPEDDDAFREALLWRVVPELARRLTDAPGIATLVAEVDADEDDDYWCGAVSTAAQLGWQDDTSRLVVWMLTQKTTTGEANSAFFHGMAAAAAELVGARIPVLGTRAAALHAAHGDLLVRFVEAQRDLTAALLNGLTEVPLHRGDALPDIVPGAPVDPSLWPLASFAVDFETAASFAHRKVSRVGGTPVVYTGIVPIGRIVATPATGFAAGGEREVVVLAGCPGDRATVTGL